LDLRRLPLITTGVAEPASPRTPEPPARDSNALPSHPVIAPSPAETAAAARAEFLRQFGASPVGVAFAPGRVNLIGEHTDYNDGFVLPMALEDGLAAAYGPNDDRVLRIHAREFGETREMALDGAVATDEPAGWFRYGVGIALTMAAAGLRVTGTNIALASTLPSDAGLSSSAAVELSIARVLAATGGDEWDPRQAARIAQRAEHEFIGVACGIMDQMAVACGRPGQALLLDCRSLTTEDVPVPQNAGVVIVYSGVSRTLAASAYNDRRAACERAVSAIRQLAPSVRALRDVDAALLDRARPRMDDVAFRRASHVIAENERPGELAALLRQDDLGAAGRLMLDSHASLRDLYEVSSVELDLLVTLAMAEPGCHGARLTGAGFGGCIVALADLAAVAPFSRSIAERYRAATRLEPRVIVSRPAAGVRLL
jgi:galactokinase